MDRLPFETLAIIMSHVGYYDLFPACCVCKRWNEVIRKTKLYKILDLDYTRNYQEAMDFFNKQKCYGQTVRYLHVSSSKNIPTNEIRQWPILFPNVTVFNLDFGPHNKESNTLFDHFGILDVFEMHTDSEEDDTEEEDSEEEERPIDRPREENFAIWKNLESVTESDKCFYTVTLLNSGTFNYLNKLVIDFERLKVSAFQELIDVLPNAPSLNDLYLTKAVFSIEILEKLHDNATQLKKLTFSAPIFLYTSDMGDFDTIMPAQSLKFLDLQGVDTSRRGKAILVKYVTKKYIHLETLRMKKWEDGLGEALLITPDISAEFESTIVELATNCKDLKSYNVDIHPYTPDILRAFDQTGSLRLKHFSSLASDTVELRSLAHSNQKDYIERLDVLVPFMVQDEFLEIINQFTQLKVLNFLPSPELFGERGAGLTMHITLDTFLKHHKHLVNLKLCTSIVSISDDFDGSNCSQSNIESLEIVSSMIETPADEHTSPRILEFWSKACSRLKILTLTCNFVEPLLSPKDIVIDFSKHDIQYLSLYLRGYAYLCLQDQQNKTAWYAYSKISSRFLCSRLGKKPAIRRATRRNPENGVIYILCKDVDDFPVHPGRDPDFVNFF